jgi:hypothetical protein
MSAQRRAKPYLKPERFKIAIYRKGKELSVEVWDENGDVPRACLEGALGLSRPELEPDRKLEERVLQVSIEVRR